MTARLALLIALLMTIGLPFDALPWNGARWLVSAATLLLLLFLWRRCQPAERRRLLTCLVLATLGEAVLSLVLHLYDYRGGGIPLFVPPGHVLLFMLGAWLTPRAPARLERWVAAAALLVALALAWAGIDRLSPLLLLLYVAAIRFGPTPRLYGVMFLLALLLELWGTGIGTWVWRPQLAWLGWPAANPPLAAGAFYCVLDWLVELLTREGRQPARYT